MTSVSDRPSPRRDLAVAASAVGAAVLAVFAWSACCVLPMALALAGVSLGGVALVAGQRAWLTAVSLVVLAGAGWVTWRRGPGPARRRLLMLLAIGGLLNGVAVLWQPVIEPRLLALLLILRR